MRRKKHRVVLLLSIVVIGLLWMASVISKPPNKFDEDRFQEDTVKIEQMYFEYQEQLQNIVQNFWDNAEIQAISVSPYEEGIIELWLEEGKLDSFEDDYSQLYNVAHSLLATDFEWSSFSRYDGQDNIVECPVFVDRYGGPYWTAFYLYFSEEEMPELNGIYCRVLSDDCVLIARNYDFA